MIPAVILTIILDVIGYRLSPGLYNEAGVPIWSLDWASAWRALAPTLFLNQLRFGVVNPGTNGPFWSLCYEFWYYAAFGTFVFVKGIKRIVLLLAIAALVNLQIIVFFPIWLLGVYIYKLIMRPAKSAGGFYGLGWLASGAGLTAVMVLKYKISALIMSRFGLPSQDVSDTFLIAERYAVGILFAVNLLCFSRIASPIAKTIINRVAPRSDSWPLNFLALFVSSADNLFLRSAYRRHLFAYPAHRAGPDIVT